MKVRIVDATALSAVAPKALHAYLRANDWEKVEAYGDKGDVYARPDAPEIVAPASSDFIDYAETLGRVISILSRTETRSELSILRDLSVADTDLIRVRAQEAEDDGSIGLEAGVELIQQSRNLLLAAACSASRPQRAYRAGKIREATEYLNDVRIGQTERGSFVVTLLSPVPPSLTPAAQGTFWPELQEEPFSRKVTRTLRDALHAVKEAVSLANRGDGIEAFESRVPKGVSANLCDAVAKLIVGGNGLDVSLAWALTRPAPERRVGVRFPRSDADILGEAAKVLREREPRPGERLQGFVTALAKGSEADLGRVTLKAMIDDKLSSVRIYFDPDDYKRVVEAHREWQPVSLEGDLQREGQRWKLLNPRDLMVLPEDPDDVDDSE